MRIDAHQHFWSLDKFAYSWMPEGESVLRRDYLPSDLAPILEEHRFDGSIAVQATTDPGEAKWLLSLADENEFLKGVVAWADLTSPHFAHKLDDLQRHPRFVGVRHPVHDEEDQRWLLRDDVLENLGELAHRGIPYDLLLRPMHLPLVPLVAERVPDLRMAIDHLAKPFIADHLMDGWAEDLAEAAKLPQVYCKLSGMITEASPQTWKPQELGALHQPRARSVRPGTMHVRQRLAGLPISGQLEASAGFIYSSVWSIAAGSPRLVAWRYRDQVLWASRLAK